MKIIFNILFIPILFISSCKNPNTETLNKSVILRVFNFVTNRYELIDTKVEIVKNGNSSVFIYSFDKKVDTLKFINNNIFFNGQKTEDIDVKSVSIKGKTFHITKCFFNDEKDFRGDKYLFVSDELGLVFIQDSYGNMYEFDKKKLQDLHKKIALNKLNFKDGNFEIKYGNKDYLKYRE